VSGEHTYEVLPLSLPEPGGAAVIDDIGPTAAVTLFTERAQAVTLVMPTPPGGSETFVPRQQESHRPDLEAIHGVVRDTSGA
jgi:hypothetical protein